MELELCRITQVKELYNKHIPIRYETVSKDCERLQPVLQVRLQR
jgi:hypothetical protein